MSDEFPPGAACCGHKHGRRTTRTYAAGSRGGKRARWGASLRRTFQRSAGYRAIGITGQFDQRTRARAGNACDSQRPATQQNRRILACLVVPDEIMTPAAWAPVGFQPGAGITGTVAQPTDGVRGGPSRHRADRAQQSHHHGDESALWRSALCAPRWPGGAGSDQRRLSSGAFQKSRPGLFLFHEKRPVA
jgi:hypothetical protein